MTIVQKLPMNSGIWTLLWFLNKWQVISETVHFLWYLEPGTVSIGVWVKVVFVKVESAPEKATETSGLDFNFSPGWANGRSQVNVGGIGLNTCCWNGSISALGQCTLLAKTYGRDPWISIDQYRMGIRGSLPPPPHKQHGVLLQH